MRVLTVVLALVAIPFVAGVSQEPFQDPKNCGVHLTPAEKADARAARAGEVLAHGGKHGVMDRPCSCAVAPAPTGTRTIAGKVSDFTDPWAPLALKDWCIELTGTVTATAMTGLDGTYSFTGLPDGTYTVCEVMQSGYEQIFPSLVWGSPCPGGLAGWTFTLQGFSASRQDFRNIVATTP